METKESVDMSATNTTSFLQLPLFTATDKPTWLGDFNGAMSKIDTGVASNNNKITEQTGQIAAVQKMAENASVTANTASSVAKSATRDAAAAASAASNAQLDATQALSKANSLESRFELVKFGQVTQTLMTPSSGLTIRNSVINYALNQDGSYGKVYGRIQATTQTGDSGQRVTLKAGSIPFKKPPSTVKVTFIGITSCTRVGQNDIDRIGIADMWLEPDGSCSFSAMSTPWTDEYVNIDIFAIPIYFKDFGDMGVEELTSLMNAQEAKFLEAVGSV
jgi:hypothetical protein